MRTSGERNKPKRGLTASGMGADSRGQALTEYAILAAIMVAISAWLYYPDNGIYQGIRYIYDKTTLVVGWPGP